jgi:hypothetical protein
MRWSRILMALILVAICFGGSFTCNSHDDHSKTTVKSN